MRNNAKVNESMHTALVARSYMIILSFIKNMACIQDQSNSYVD